MKKLCTFFAVCGLMFVAALIVGCGGLLDAGVATNIFRDSNSLIRGGGISLASNVSSVHWEKSKLEASGSTPVFIATVYGNNATGSAGKYVDHHTPEAVHWFENDISPKVMWGLIPSNLKKYSVLGLHANAPNKHDNPMDKEQTKRWYDEQLTICDRMEAPAMIVVMAARGGYGASNYSFNAFDPQGTDKSWVQEMVKKHPSLKGFITTEHYWTGYQSGDDELHGKWLKTAEELDKTLLIHDKAFEKDDYGVKDYFSDSTFKAYALVHGDDHLILGTKYTSAGEQHEAHSYAQGAWLTGVSHAYGGLIDTWSWAERGYGEPMTNSKDSHTDGGQYRYKSNAVTQYPGGVLASFMMQMYLNGATVFNFEAPWVICASEGKASTHMVDVIAPFFDWMAENPAPTEVEMRAITKNYFFGDKVLTGTFYPPNFDPGNNDASYKTGRYGLVPFVTDNLFSTAEEVKRKLDDLGGNVKKDHKVYHDAAASDWDDPGDGYYEQPMLPATKGGNGAPFAAIRKIDGFDTYFFYNTHIGGTAMTDSSHIQYARIPIGTEEECDINGDTCSARKFMEVGLTPHTAVIVKREAANTLRVWMCNARVDTSSSPAFDGTKVGQWNDGRVGMDYWIAQNLCIGGSHTVQNQNYWMRDTVFHFEGASSLSEIRIDGQQMPFSQIRRTGNVAITTVSNGWIEFTVTVN